jgi:hypothetical protein
MEFEIVLAREPGCRSSDLPPIYKNHYGSGEVDPRRMVNGGITLLLYGHENNNKDNNKNKNTACIAMRHAGICHRATQLSRYSGMGDRSSSPFFKIIIFG